MSGGAAMRGKHIGRRTFIQSAAAGIAALTALRARPGQAQVAVPNSVGTELPKLKAPPGACDCHHHIYDAGRFPPKDPGPQFQPNGRVEEYKLLQRRIGTTRNVIVSPAAYVDNNSVTLDAIQRLGTNARGVALLTTAVSDAELKRLTDGGVRGVRFSQNPPTVTSTFDMIEPLAKRVITFGWHVQLYLPA